MSVARRFLPFRRRISVSLEKNRESALCLLSETKEYLHYHMGLEPVINCCQCKVPRVSQRLILYKMKGYVMLIYNISRTSFSVIDTISQRSANINKNFWKYYQGLHQEDGPLLWASQGSYTALSLILRFIHFQLILHITTHSCIPSGILGKHMKPHLRVSLLIFATNTARSPVSPWRHFEFEGPTVVGRL